MHSSCKPVGGTVCGICTNTHVSTELQMLVLDGSECNSMLQQTAQLQEAKSSITMAEPSRATSIEGEGTLWREQVDALWTALTSSSCSEQWGSLCLRTRSPSQSAAPGLQCLRHQCHIHALPQPAARRGCRPCVAVLLHVDWHMLTATCTCCRTAVSCCLRRSHAEVWSATGRL